MIATGVVPRHEERMADPWFPLLLWAANGDLTRYDEVKRTVPVYRLWALGEAKMKESGVKIEGEE